MCEYAEYDENNTLICKPKNSRCLLCVLGNGKQYQEIKGRERDERSSKRNDI